MQDAVKVKQRAAGRFEIPNWDPASQNKVRDALLVLGARCPISRKAFGSRFQVDPVRHLIGTAAAWGGNPDKDAAYPNVTPSKNDGAADLQAQCPREVPVNAFWSVTVYNADGFFQKNQYDAYSLNSITAKKARTAPSPSSSAAATARSRIACRHRRAGITWYASIVHATKS